MVQRIRNDRIFFTKQGLKYTAVSIKSGSIEDGIFCSEELGNFFFQLFMDILCAADKTNAAHTIAM